jgi:rhodanese-related sulfurtransferase
MNIMLSVSVRASIIASICICLGIVSNLIPTRHIPWLYVPPKEVTIANHKIPLIDSEQAQPWLEDKQTVFVDTREEKDYMAGHVPGAISLTPENKEEKFPGLEPLMPQASRIVLYCYGPDCDMAERVASFLLDFGYTDLMIMSDGYPGWEQKGFPSEQSHNRRDQKGKK